jgi:hypothetical protein
MSQSRSSPDVPATSAATVHPAAGLEAVPGAMRIEGDVRLPDGNGIHGLTIELVDERFAFAERLEKTLTNGDGWFSLTYDPADFPDLFEARPQVTVRVRDRTGQVIHTVDETIRWASDTRTLSVRLMPEALTQHLRTPITWEPVTGPLIPEDRWQIVDTAIGLLAPPGNPSYDHYRGIARCPAPELIAFGSLLEDAFLVLRGDINAMDRFATSLHLADQREGFEQPIGPGPFRNGPVVDEPVQWTASLATAEDSVRERGVESMIPDGHLTPVLAAAAYLDALGRGGADYYLDVLNHQLCGLSKLNALWHASRAALDGDPRQVAYFRGVLERVGTGCGPDDNPLTGWPMPKPKPSLCVAPGFVLRCMVQARTVIFDLLKPQKISPSPTLPPYTVTAITPQTACSGQDVVITGSGFGQNPQSVRFPGAGAVSAKTWTDTRIDVTVPPGAGCGDLRLIRPSVAAGVCGRFVDIAWPGSGATYFDGTEARINGFTANGRTASWNAPLRVDPDATVTLAWSVCPTSNSTVDLKVWAGGSLLVSLPSVAPDGTYAVALPNYTQTTLLECVLTASNPCVQTPVVERVYLKAYKIANLTIDGIEVTQGLQYYRAASHLTDAADRGADNSLTLVEGKPAYVRVYVRSGQDPGFDNGQVSNVSGWVTLYRTAGGVSSVTDFYPLNPGMTAYANPAYATERSTLGRSLNFLIPASEMRGQLTIHAFLYPAPFSSSAQYPFQSTTVSVPLRQTLQVAGIMVGYNGPNAANTGNLNLAAPAQQNLLTTLGFSLAAYPVAATPQLRVAATLTQTVPLNDPAGATGCSPNWDALFAQCVQARTNDGNQPGWIYCGILANGIPIGPVLGCGGNGIALFTVGAGSTAASENGHALGLLPLAGGGLGHAPVPNGAGALPADADPSFPAYEPYDAANTPRGRIGEYGLDVSNGNVLSPAVFRDIMSAFIVPQMWVSLYTFGLLTNNAGLNHVAM